METRNKIILVTGATGRQGGAVAKHLLADGWKVRAMTRNPDKPEARRLAEMGAEVVKGDFDLPSTLDDAARGVYGVFSVQSPFQIGVDEELKQGIAIADAAKRAGVKHFIYSSVGSADEKTGIPFFESKRQIEEYVRTQGIPWTIFRPVSFMENLNNPDTRNSILNGELALALDPDIPMQLIAVDDIGAFVTKAFEDPEYYVGRAIDIAGDELTGPEMADILSRVVGRQVSYKQLSVDDMRAYGSDTAMMWDWLNLRGYDANIPVLREIFPTMKNFDNWVAQFVWHK
jgi:uncharacterized protein YbjT (DUF2867 family)